MFQLFFTTLFNLTLFVNSQNAVVPNRIAPARTSFTKVAPINKTPKLNNTTTTTTNLNRGGAGSWDDNN